ncbi:hypothetical protein [Actinomadura geliboluensis]|uniref:hypothetical protein n=1 Tax=Actinomadura geliboluensis TaxID=882440 RepID=UPI0037175F02
MAETLAYTIDVRSGWANSVQPGDNLVELSRADGPLDQREGKPVDATTGLLVLGLMLLFSILSGITGAMIFKDSATPMRRTVLHGFGTFTATLGVLMAISLWFTTVVKP